MGVNAICVLTNAVRLDPKKYLQKFGDAKTANSCASKSNGGLPLLFMHADLCKAAKYHSTQMANKNTLSHNSLDGAAGGFAPRISRFFKESKTLAENIARGTTYKDAVKLENAWIASPGHCANIMNKKYNTIGLGFDQKKDYFGDQTFAGIKRQMTSKIACGSHIIHKGKLVFMVAVKNGGQPTVVVGGRRIPMRAEFKNKEGAVFTADGSSVAKGGCAKFHFALGNEKYPKGFELTTEGWGSCQPKMK